MLAAGCALAAISGLAWTLPAAPLRVRREIAPAKVPRGDPALAVLTLANVGRRRRNGLRLVDVCGGGRVEVDVPSLPARSSQTVSYRVPTEQRGEIVVGPLELVRADPLGMARRVQAYGGRGTLLVRPRVHALPVLTVGRARQLEGSLSDTAPSGTITFRSLREYVPGDDLRHIHWRSSARLGTLMTRELIDASRPWTTIVLDLRPGVYAGGAPSFELAVDAVASIAVAAGRRSFPVTVLSTAGPVMETRGGRADAGALLDRLAVETPRPGGSLTGTLESLRHSRAGGVLVVVTGCAGDPAELARVAIMRARFERVVTVRIGPASGTVPSAGTAWSVGGTGWVDASSAEDLVAGWRREAAR